MFGLIKILKAESLEIKVRNDLGIEQKLINSKRSFRIRAKFKSSF